MSVIALVLPDQPTRLGVRLLVEREMNENIAACKEIACTEHAETGRTGARRPSFDS
jgi:hypothetical protein